MKQKKHTTLIHEHSSNGNHRIVALSSDGTNVAGEWVPQQQLAQHPDVKVLANSTPDIGLPLGIFRTFDVPHQVL